MHISSDKGKNMNVESLINTVRFIAEGGVTTLAIWAVTIITSIPLGIVVAIIGKNGPRVFRSILKLYVSFIRGTPLLFQLLFVYFGLPILCRLELPPFVAASVVFINSWTIYFSEVFRGGIESVERGQYEAAQMLGLTYLQTMRFIILPQALVAVLPEITNQTIEAIWGTALLSTIGMNDMLKAARVVLMRDFSFTPFIIAGIMYFLFNGFVTLLFRRIERRCRRYRISYRGARI